MVDVSKASRALTGVLAALVISMPALAADWQVRPRLSVSETYTDNVDLDPEGAESHEFVTEVTPGVSLSGTGKRLNLNFDYQASLVNYARGTDGARVDVVSP